MNVSKDMIFDSVPRWELFLDPKELTSSDVPWHIVSAWQWFSLSPSSLAALDADLLLKDLSDFGGMANVANRMASLKVASGFDGPMLPVGFHGFSAGTSAGFGVYMLFAVPEKFNVSQKHMHGFYALDATHVNYKFSSHVVRVKNPFDAPNSRAFLPDSMAKSLNFFGDFPQHDWFHSMLDLSLEPMYQLPAATYCLLAQPDMIETALQFNADDTLLSDDLVEMLKISSKDLSSYDNNLRLITSTLVGSMSSGLAAAAHTVAN